MQIDTSTDFGRRVERRLREEPIIWLITVRRDGTPQPTPVSFLWDGGDHVLIYSQPNQQKLRNIANDPIVSLHLDGDGHGGDIVVLTGTATIDENGGAAGLPPAYVEKNAADIAGAGMTPETMAQIYSTAIHVAVTHVHGHL